MNGNFLTAVIMVEFDTCKYDKRVGDKLKNVFIVVHTSLTRK